MERLGVGPELLQRCPNGTLPGRALSPYTRPDGFVAEREEKST
jgi:hypothetical protein